MKRMLCALTAVWIGLLGAMEWKNNGNALSFTADGKTFHFTPGGYSGIQFAGSDFFFHLPVWNADGARLEDLRLQNRIRSVGTVQKNDFSETVEALVPMLRLNEAKGTSVPSPCMAKFRFRIWKDIAALSVSCIVENREKVPLEMSPFWMGRHLSSFGFVTGTRHSPPPEHLVREPMTKQTLPGGPVLLLSKETPGQNSALGIIGSSGRYWTGNLLQLFAPKQTVPPGGTLEFHLIFALPGPDAKEGYSELEKMEKAIGILDSVAFLKEDTAENQTIPANGPFRRFAAVKQKDGTIRRIPDGFARKQTYADFMRKDGRLLVRFRCEEPEPAKMMLKFGAAGDPVWDDDCVELFAASDWKKRGYSHYLANAKGARNQLSRNVSLNREKQNWDITPAIGAKDWSVLFSIDRNNLDSRMIAEEHYLPLHLNRESHSGNEFSGWPTERFQDPSSFGRLIFTSYPDYLEHQLSIVRRLAEKSTSEIAKPFHALLNHPPQFRKNNFRINALADADLRECRRKLEFDLELKRGETLLRQSAKEKRAGQELKELLENLENAVESEEMLRAFNRLRGDVLKQLSAGATFLVWSKPADLYLSGDDFPPTGKNHAAETVLCTGIGEYESAAFAVTNVTDHAKEIEVKVRKNSAGVPVTLRYGHVARSSIGEVNDALPLLNGTLKVPPRKSREVHLTLHTGSLKPGIHRIELLFRSGTETFLREIRLEVLPVTMKIPENIFNVFYSPVSMMRQAGGPEMLNAFLNDMDSHYYGVRQLDGGSIPKPVFSADGSNQTDYDTYLNDRFRGLKKGDLCMTYWGFYLGNRDRSRAKLESLFGAPFLSDLFRKRFTTWLKDWYGKLEERGLADKLYMYMFDETTHADAEELMKLAKQTVPEMKIFLTVTTTSSPEDIRRVLPYLDAISPHFYTWKNNPEVWRMIRESGVKLSPYFNVAPASSKDEPYSVYRRMAWLARSVGAHGCGTWIYFYSVPITWSPVTMNMVLVKSPAYKDSFQGAPEHLAPGELIVPTKRWEAYREGMEDFFYLKMLEEEIKKAPATPLAKRASAFLAEAERNVCNDTGTEQAARSKAACLKLLAEFRNP